MFTAQLTKQFSLEAEEIAQVISSEFGVERAIQFLDELIHFTVSLASANVTSQTSAKSSKTLKILFQRKNWVYYRIDEREFVFTNISLARKEANKIK